MKGGWQRYTLGTWALLALQFGVTAGSVVLCAATPAGDSRWAAVGVALTVVAATACVVLPAVSKDDQQRREVTAAIKQLERSTQAALQLARQLRQRRMWRSWKKVYGLFLKMNLTVSQVRGMRVA